MTRIEIWFHRGVAVLVHIDRGFIIRAGHWARGKYTEWLAE